MNITLIQEQMAYIELTLETEDEFEVYGGTTRAPFEFQPTGVASWRVIVRESEVVGAAIRSFDVYARQRSSGREWVVLSGRIFVKPRTADIEGDKLSPVEYHVSVPVVDSVLETQGMAIVTGIPGPQGPRGEKGEPGEGGMTSEERATLAGAAQRGGVNTFTAANTFTGSVDMSTASVTPPEGWNVGELTAEQVQAVVPIAWSNESNAKPSCTVNGDQIAVGAYAQTKQTASIAIGGYATTERLGCTAVGWSSKATLHSCTAFGYEARATFQYATSVGSGVFSAAASSITIGAKFVEVVDGATVTRTTTTQGTGSITIGAGANTKNNGSTESSNSVTIGCKAENKGADSVVIGAQASGAGAGIVAIGVGAEGTYSYGSDVVIGKNAKGGGSSVIVGALVDGRPYQGTCVGFGASIAREAVALGHNSKAGVLGSIALGKGATANASTGIALGYLSQVADAGAVVVASWDGSRSTKTQLYFSGAGTPLANTYHGGAPMLGYVTKDSAGNIVAAGTRSLIDLLTDNSTFAPASLDENGEWVAPKVFHPSDLDMPQEEPSETEEYQPLPVYPIVEPEVDELRTPTQEI